IDSIAMNVSLPEEVTAALTAGVARGVETRGYVQNVGDVGRLQQVRAADATLAAAENPGGAAGAMVGAGIGLGLGGQLGQTIAANQAAGATPPPLLAAMYHVEVNGAATGPYNLQQLQQAMQAGQLQGSTLVWTNGMAGWAAASSVAQLAPLFATPPPPPPPPPPPAPPAPSAPPGS
ncbi:MAG TPA: DUF4339 domain-containing protein, partial [Sporichthya sp.]|nr:DUF4339 domain-containing protein [Sporichthya sp.]